MVAASTDSFGYDRLHIFPSLLTGIIRYMRMLRFVDKQFAAFEADTFEHFHNFLNMLNKEYWTTQFDMSEISRSVNMGETVGGAYHTWF